MKTTLGLTAATLLLLLTGGVARAQGGTMIDGRWGGGWMSGHGFPWVPFLVIAAVVAAIVWLVRRNRK